MLNVDYFNPVVEDWNEKAQKEEEIQKKACDYRLYVITPLMKGAYAIAEAVDDSNKRPTKTLFCILQRDYNKVTDQIVKFDGLQIRSLKKVAELIEKNKAKVFWSLDEVAKFLQVVSQESPHQLASTYSATAY